MDIIKENFRQQLPEIRKAINEAAFFSIDGEFTGLSDGGTAFDTPEEYFHKTYDSSNGFILIQLGLTAFKVSPDNPDKFIFKSLNFYIYPRFRSNVFKCQGESMAFLAKNGFDFNKLFCDGVACCTIAHSEKLRENLTEKRKQRELILNETVPQVDFSHHICVSEDDQLWLNDVKESIEHFLSSAETELVIDNRNGFQRKLIYQMIESSYNGNVSTISRDLENNRKALVIVRKRTLEEERKLEQEKIEKEDQDLEDIIGISSVIQLISESKKLVVGHNMLLDVLYILRQCYGEVPRKYEEFKEFTHSIFPNILDTKYLTSLDKFKTHINSTVLLHVYDSVTKEPFKMPEYEAESPDYSYSMDKPQEHNAGFDSFMTGLCFLSLTNYMEIKPQHLTAQTPSLKNKKNKLFCMRLQDVFHINLLGKEPIVARDHVFHVTFPAVWKTSDIINHFKSFGNIFVGWLGDTTAYVALHRKENAKELIKKIGYVKGVQIQTYQDYHKTALENNQTISHAAAPSSKKRKDGSDNSADHGCSKAKNKKLFAKNDTWQ